PPRAFRQSQARSHRPSGNARVAPVAERRNTGSLRRFEALARGHRLARRFATTVADRLAGRAPQSRRQPPAAAPPPAARPFGVEDRAPRRARAIPPRDARRAAVARVRRPRDGPGPRPEWCGYG